jgi:hypothetical protein
MPTQRTRDASDDAVARSADARWEHRLEMLEGRTERLERQLEGLQDAVYRQAILEDRNIVDLRRRIEPGRMARDLDQDARKRGL